MNKPDGMGQLEFARLYHSDERMAFVSGMFCCACGRQPTHCHHIGKRPLHYTRVAPLCEACCRLVNQVGEKAFESRFGLSLSTQARLTHLAWARHQVEHLKWCA